jgi:hypothetical protein
MMHTYREIGSIRNGARIWHAYEDLVITTDTTDTARNLKVSLPVRALAQQPFSGLPTNGYGYLNHLTVVNAIEMLSNAQRRPLTWR